MSHPGLGRVRAGEAGRMRLAVAVAPSGAVLIEPAPVDGEAEDGLSSPARARVLGIPVNLSELLLSLEEPEAFVVAAGRSSTSSFG